MLKVMLFFDQINLKGNWEKETFFTSLPEVLRSIPTQIQVRHPLSSARTFIQYHIYIPQSQSVIQSIVFIYGTVTSRIFCFSASSSCSSIGATGSLSMSDAKVSISVDLYISIIPFF